LVQDAWYRYYYSPSVISEGVDVLASALIYLWYEYIYYWRNNSYDMIWTVSGAEGGKTYFFPFISSFQIPAQLRQLDFKSCLKIYMYIFCVTNKALWILKFASNFVVLSIGKCPAFVHKPYCANYIWISLCFLATTITVYEAMSIYKFLIVL